MKKLILAFVMLSSTAQSQIAPSPAPLILEKPDQDKLMNYLMEQPTKFSLPVIQFLNEIQQRQLAALKEKSDGK